MLPKAANVSQRLTSLWLENRTALCLFTGEAGKAQSRDVIAAILLRIYRLHPP
jgi:hypothetical protein